MIPLQNFLFIQQSRMQIIQKEMVVSENNQDPKSFSQSRERERGNFVVVPLNPMKTADSWEKFLLLLLKDKDQFESDRKLRFHRLTRHTWRWWRSRKHRMKISINYMLEKNGCLFRKEIISLNKNFNRTIDASFSRHSWNKSASQTLSYIFELKRCMLAQ